MKGLVGGASRNSPDKISDETRRKKRKLHLHSFRRLLFLMPSVAKNGKQIENEKLGNFIGLISKEVLFSLSQFVCVRFSSNCPSFFIMYIYFSFICSLFAVWIRAATAQVRNSFCFLSRSHCQFL